MKFDIFVETGALTVDAINNIAFNFHKVSGLEGSRSVWDGSITDHIGEFSVTMANLARAFSRPEVFNGLITPNLKQLIDRMRSLQSAIETVKSRPGQNESEKNQSLTNFAQSIAYVNEWLVTHNIVLKLDFFRTPTEVEESIKKTDSFIAKIPSYEKTLDELLGVGALARMAGSYRTRKESVATRKNIYLFLAAACIAFGMYYVNNLVQHFEPIFGAATKDTASLILPMLVLGMSAFLPIFLSITIFWGGYSRERKFEEEYAFREALSSTLSSLTNTIDDPEKKNAAITSALAELFKPSGKARNDGPPVMSLKQVERLIGALGKVRN